jgi:uncharacterized protein (DUF1697 family)
MTAYVALLRAVNVGGTGKLPMATLKELCLRAGFTHVQTYIASGNVVFQSAKGEKEVKAALESALATFAGKPQRVLVRTATQMVEVLANNPFASMPPNRTVAIFLDGHPSRDSSDKALGRNKEEIGLGKREIYVYYPDGIGRSRLKIPGADSGTARNMNTVAKLAELTSRS